MKKVLKIIGIVIGVFLLLIILAALILPRVIDINSFKPMISDIVREQTGRELVIASDIKLKILPRFSLELRDVSFSNASGFAPENMAEIREMSVGVAVFPLIRKNIEITRIVVDGVHVYYGVNADGRSNIQDILDMQAAKAAVIPPETPAEPAEEQAAAPAEGGGINFNLREARISLLSITDIILNYEDVPKNMAYRVSVINVNAEDVGLDRPVDLALSARLEELATGMAVDVNLATTLLVGETEIDAKLQNIDLKAKLPANDLEAEVVLVADASYDLQTQNASLALTSGKVTARLPGQGIETSVNIAADAAYDMNKLLAELKIKTLAVSAKLRDQGLNATININDTDAVYDMNAQIAALTGLKMNIAANMQQDNSSIDAAMSLNANASYDMGKQFARLSLTDTTGNVKMPAQELTAALTIDDTEATYDMAKQFAEIKSLVLSSNITSAMMDGPQSIKLNTALTFDMKQEKLDLKKLDLNALGVAINAKIAGTKVLSNPDLSGSLTIAEFSPKDIMKRLKINFQTIDPAALTKFNASVANFSFRNKVATVPLQLSLDGTAINTNVKADISQAKPSIDATVNVGTINADRYMPVAGAAKPTTPTTSAPAATPQTNTPAAGAGKLAIPRIDLDLTGLPNVNATVNVTKLTVMKSDFSNIVLKATLKDGIATTNWSLGLFSGKTTGDARVVAQKDKFEAAVNAAVTSLNLHTVLSTFAPDVDRTIIPQKATVNLSASVKGTEVAELSKLNATLDTLTIAGNAKADFTPNKPMITFKFDVGDVNVRKYLPKQTAPKPAATQATVPANGGRADPASTEAAGASATPLDLNTLPVNANGTVTVRSVVYDQFSARNIKATVKAENGSATLSPLYLETFGGNINVTGSLQSKAGKLPGAYKVNLNKIKMGDVITAFRNDGKKPVFTGDLSAEADITLAGITPDEILESINGRMDYVLAGGVVNGIGYDPKALNTANIASFKLIDPKKSTRLDDVKGAVAFEKGRMNFERMTMTSGNMQAFAIGGTVLKGVEMDFDGTIKVDTVEVPLNITGKFTSPRVTIDYQKMLTGLVKQYGEKAAQDALKNVIEKNTSIKLPTGTPSNKEDIGKQVEDNINREVDKGIERGKEELQNSLKNLFGK